MRKKEKRTRSIIESECTMLNGVKKVKNQLTLEMAIAVSMQAFLGLLTIELTFKSRSSSAVFWDCHVFTKGNQIQIKHLVNPHIISIVT